MRNRMRISPLLYGVFWVWLLVGAILAGVIWSLLWLVHYLTTPSEIGHGDGGTSSITQGLRPIGKRSLRKLAIEEFEQRQLTSADILLVTNIYTFYDELEPIHIMIIESKDLASGEKLEHGPFDQASLAS